MAAPPAPSVPTCTVYAFSNCRPKEKRRKRWAEMLSRSARFYTQTPADPQQPWPREAVDALFHVIPHMRQREEYFRHLLATAAPPPVPPPAQRLPAPLVCTRHDFDAERVARRDGETHRQGADRRRRDWNELPGEPRRKRASTEPPPIPAAPDCHDVDDRQVQQEAADLYTSFTSRRQLLKDCHRDMWHRLRKLQGVDNIITTGSFAWGTVTASSDVDFIVQHSLQTERQILAYLGDNLYGWTMRRQNIDKLDSERPPVFRKNWHGHAGLVDIAVRQDALVQHQRVSAAVQQLYLGRPERDVATLLTWLQVWLRQTGEADPAQPLQCTTLAAHHNYILQQFHGAFHRLLFVLSRHGATPSLQSAAGQRRQELQGR